MRIPLFLLVVVATPLTAVATVQTDACVGGATPNSLIQLISWTFSPSLTGATQSGTFSAAGGFTCVDGQWLPCSAAPAGCASIYGTPSGFAGNWTGNCALATLTFPGEPNSFITLVGGTVFGGVGERSTGSIRWVISGALAPDSVCGESNAVGVFAYAQAGTN